MYFYFVSIDFKGSRMFAMDPLPVMTTWMVMRCLCFSPQGKYTCWLTCAQASHVSMLPWAPPPNLWSCPTRSWFGSHYKCWPWRCYPSNQEILSRSKVVPKTSSLPLNFFVLLQVLIHPLILFTNIWKILQEADLVSPSWFSFLFDLRPCLHPLRHHRLKVFLN